MDKQFIVVVCGPTASGKTGLGIQIAKEFGGEIISADSMQIYKGMHIATAKPSEEDKQGIPHHLMDFYDPCDSFSVADYVKLAHAKIADVASRGKLPIIVGGTGLYINSLINNYIFEESECDYEYREELRQIAIHKGNEHLLRMLEEIDPDTAKTLHPNNLSRIIRALEVYKVTGKTMSEMQKLSRAVPSPYDPCMIALDYDRELLYDRINDRVDIMLASGLIDEAINFFSRDRYPTAAQALGYKEIFPFFCGEKELEECVENLKRETRKYAKRQMTWFRKDPRIHWIKVNSSINHKTVFEDAKNYIKTCGNFQ